MCIKRVPLHNGRRSETGFGLHRKTQGLPSSWRRQVAWKRWRCIWCSKVWEAATKGLARVTGKSHEQVYGHNNLMLFTEVLNQVVAATETAPYIDSLLSEQVAKGGPYDTVAILRDMLRRTASPKRGKIQEEIAETFFANMLTASPEIVGRLLELPSKLDNTINAELNNPDLIAAITGKPYTLKPPYFSKNLANSLAQKLLAQIVKRLSPRRHFSEPQLQLLHKAVPRIIANVIASKGEEQFLLELKASDGQYLFHQEEMMGFFSPIKAFMGLLIVGAIVWPHESFPRYAASPNAPETIEEAVRPDGGKGRQLGSRHYTDDVGVIKHISELSTQAERITATLKESYDAGFLVS